MGRRLLLSAPLGSALVLLCAAGGVVAEGPTIEAGGGAYGYYWSPSSTEVSSGGTVTIRSPSGSVPHGVTWTGGPETPECSGVPINEGKTSWSGTCAFAQAGAYAFRCTIHPVEMTGTIYARSSGTVSPPPSEAPKSPPAGPAVKTLKLARDQRGGRVRGSIDLSPAAAGSRLRVDVLASRRSLFRARRAGTLRVGRLVRSSLQAGRASFAIPIKRVARRALLRRKRLPLRVRVFVKPPGGKALRSRRTVVLRKR